MYVCCNGVDQTKGTAWLYWLARACVCVRQTTLNDMNTRNVALAKELQQVRCHCCQKCVVLLTYIEQWTYPMSLIRQAAEHLRAKSVRLEAAEAEVDKQSRDAAHTVSSLQATIDKLKSSRGEQHATMQAEVQLPVLCYVSRWLSHFGRVLVPLHTPDGNRTLLFLTSAPDVHCCCFAAD